MSRSGCVPLTDLQRWLRWAIGIHLEVSKMLISEHAKSCTHLLGRIKRFIGTMVGRRTPGATSSDAELDLYLYVRNSVTLANTERNPTPIDESSEQFFRLIEATDDKGNRLIRVDPRSVLWFFGADNLPLSQHSMAFGDRVYFAWDYDPTDPVLTRAMAYELARIRQQRQAGGEIAFARRHVAGSSFELLDQADGKQSRLMRERNTVARLWQSWWDSVGHFRPGVNSEETSDTACEPAIWADTSPIR